LSQNHVPTSRGYLPRDLAGEVIPAEEIARMTAANLQDEFATVVATADVLRADR
jgi:hypothetical protein